MKCKHCGGNIICGSCLLCGRPQGSKAVKIRGRYLPKTFGDDPYVDLCLATLALAKEDAKMWQDFEAEFGKMRSPDPQDVAIWVSSWLFENKKREE